MQGSQIKAYIMVARITAEQVQLSMNGLWKHYMQQKGAKIEIFSAFCMNKTPNVCHLKHGVVY